jgi:hypothetical protein
MRRELWHHLNSPVGAAQDRHVRSPRVDGLHRRARVAAQGWIPMVGSSPSSRSRRFFTSSDKRYMMSPYLLDGASASVLVLEPRLESPPCAGRVRVPQLEPVAPAESRRLLTMPSQPSWACRHVGRPQPSAASGALAARAFRSR